MTKPWLILGAILLLTLSCLAQAPPVNRPRPFFSPIRGDSAAYFQKTMGANENGGRPVQPAAGRQPMPAQNAASALRRPKPAQTGAFAMGKAVAVGKAVAGKLVTGRSARPLGASACIDTMGHILTSETNNTGLGVDYITKTRDGGVLAPGYRWSSGTPPYTFPYLVKYTQQGSIAWAKSFDGLGIYPRRHTIRSIFEWNVGGLTFASGQ
ncbi:hypothetical protein ACX0G9_12310 [Flavitalea flava]